MMDVLIAVKRLATFMVAAAIMVLVAPLVFGYAILKIEWLRLLGKPTNPTEVRHAAQALQRAAVAAKAKADWTLEGVSRIAVSPTLVVDDRLNESNENDRRKALNRLPGGMSRTYLENS